MEIKSNALKIFREHGYETQIAVAKALIEQGTYDSKIHSLQSYLSDILSGKVSASHKIKSGLLSLCGNDPQLESLLDAKVEGERDSSYHLRKVLELGFVQFRSYFSQAKKSKQLKMCLDLEALAEKYQPKE